MQSLRYKIGWSYSVLVLIGLATSIFAMYTFTRLRETVEPILEETYSAAVSAENLVRALDKQEVAQLNALVGDWELHQSYAKDARDDFLRALDLTRQQNTHREQQSVVDSIIIDYRTYLQASDSLFQLLGHRQTRDIALRYQQFVIGPLTDRLKTNCFRLLEANQIAMQRTNQVVRDTTRNAIILVIFASIASITLSLLAGIQFTRTIIRPAEHLTEIVRKISQGHLNQKVDVTTNDEIGELSVEFNKMTERLRAYEQMNVRQLIAEKNKSETIVANIADPIIVTDEKDRLILLNQAAAALLDAGTNNWNGRKLNEVLQDKKWTAILQSGGTSKRDQDRREILIPVERDGATLYFRPRQMQILDDRRRMTGRVTLLQDVTRFKDLDKMKSEFVATVSHELRTPLTSLSMGIDILSKEVLGAVNERQRDVLAAAKDDCERLRKLIKDLLDLSRLESGKLELARELIDLRMLIDDTIRPLHLPFQEKHIRLEVEVPPTIPRFTGDAHQLSWVLNNLLSNALRHTDEGGVVTIRASATPREIQVAVEDTGRGIPLEAQETIFEKFVQIKSSTETTPGSVGLGLSIAREVVEAHGGRIGVTSVVGKGSTFTFAIPLGNA